MLNTRSTEVIENGTQKREYAYPAPCIILNDYFKIERLICTEFREASAVKSTIIPEEWRLETGDWRLETGDWRANTGL